MLIVGVWLGFAGDITAGKVLAFAFLVTLFVGPVQMGTQVLTDAQNAIAGWRRVIGILDTPADLVDPGPRRPGAAARTDRRAIRRRRRSPTPAGPPVLHDVDLDIAARHPARGRRRDRLGQDHARQAAHPADGPDRRRGAARRHRPARRAASLAARAAWCWCRRRASCSTPRCAANALYGRLDATDDDILAAAAELGLADWLDALPRGLDTRVGQRGESLSAGERQLVALLRAHLADPDLLVLDEATSAVDPALEMRIGRALERLMNGRTSVTIAHRMSHRRERRRGRRRRPRPDRAARPARRAGRRGRRLRRAARLLGRPAGPRLIQRLGWAASHRRPPGYVAGWIPTSSRLAVLWGRCNSEPAVKVRDPAAASSRLTRWNSWTDGQSPDGKSNAGLDASHRVPYVARYPSSHPSGSATQRTRRDRPWRPPSSSSARCCARSALSDPRCTPRPEPPGRLRPADADGDGDRRGPHRGAGTPHAEADALAAPVTGPAARPRW